MKRAIFKNRNVRSALLIIVGLLFGWLLFHNPEKSSTPANNGIAAKDSDDHKQIWTCAMHPQIRMDHPGKCPICGMDLIPLNKSNADVDPNAVQMSELAMKLAEVQTTIVGHGNASKELRLYGKIQPDERLLVSQSAHVPGRIEQLLVNVTGEKVSKGQLIARIYSPELITAQKELLEAKTLADKYPEVLEAAREKLRAWKLSDSQIAGIEKSGSVKTIFDIYATRSGVVAERKVNAGDYVSQGQVLFDMADLSQLWAIFDVYEADLSWISMGDNVEFTTQAIPGKTFNGRISFIDPVMDPSTRVTKIRVELPNSGMQFKPEMFVNGIVHSGQKSSGEQLVIPKSAVLWTGTRSVVYVKVPGAAEPTFKMQEVTLGNSLQNSYEVVSGLAGGAEIVTNGAFSVDAAAQLEGKTSMMNPEGVSTNTMPGMDMTDHSKAAAPEQKSSAGTKKTSTNMDFVMQLNGVYDQYLVLKNSLVQSDASKAKEASKNMEAVLSKVNMSLLTGSAHRQWMDIVSRMNSQLSQISKSGDIQEQRIAFSGLSNALYKAVKNFGLMKKTVYYQFCPMFNKTGAYWLSESSGILNPYYGQSMLTCGETKETMKF
jgi:Cu(I)/Ag(I) efflux system membrane fusion protein